MCGFCNVCGCVCVCVWMGFVMCECVCVCVGFVMCGCVCVCVCVGFVMCGCLVNVCTLNLFGYPDSGFSVIFPQL
jgi:hypothetical protein